MKETWFLIGASSAMARAFARLMASEGTTLVLCGRDLPDLAATAADARARGASSTEVLPLDLRDGHSVAQVVKAAGRVEGPFSVAVFAGSMPDQAAVDADASLISGTALDGFTGPAELLHQLAPLMESRGAGAVIGVSSVAGDRGRYSNYVYGAAKAGFATYLSGLRNRLGRSGVHVMTVKPGPVDTAMTWGLPGLLFMTTPEAAARDMVRGLRKRRNVIYTAGIWRYIMLVIRLVPEAIFKKTSF